ncbi:hypothetical protein [Aquimarina algiphila]|uniref:hypothetical protein n=1 Tax=Aquimarina algiphila TaxID=2047982 RepID=UPI00232C68BD|nr:hypothetical protein [Aquimarina algiphila]
MRKFIEINILLIMTVFLFSSMMNLTGPSSIASEINPISINENGEILCKTRFTKNQMGGYSPMRVEYGFCILSKDTIIQFRGKVLEDNEAYYEQLKYWDDIFKSEINEEQLNELNKEVLKNEYNFSSCNANSFKVDKTMPISEFETNKKINLKDSRQKALHGASSTSYYDEKKVHLLYDFGHILLLNNINDDNDEEELSLGSDFDYYNPWVNEEGKEVNIGFDISLVTGVLITE